LVCATDARESKEKRHTAENTTSRPDASQGRSKAVATVGGHGGLGDLEGLAEGGDFKHVEAGAEEQVGELDGLLLQLVASRGGRSGGGDHDRMRDFAAKGVSLTKGKRVLLCEGG
jgi:hypothetical protein